MKKEKKVNCYEKLCSKSSSRNNVIRIDMGNAPILCQDAPNDSKVQHQGRLRVMYPFVFMDQIF